MLALVLTMLAAPVQEDATTDLRARLRATAEAKMAEHDVPGMAILVLREGEPFLFEGVGYADREQELAPTPDTVFNIASISKIVAAWGYMRLVQKGELDLDEPVVPKLSGFELPRSRHDADGVTLRRILCHTAGLNVHGIAGFEPGRELPPLVDVLKGKTPSCKKVRLQYAPGDRFSYSGGGYLLAQLLFEELEGAAFGKVLRDEVLEPLGMESSGFGWSEELLASAAVPYDRRGKRIEGHRFVGVSAAGFQTTAADLARFVQASMPAFRRDGDKDVLSDELLRSMLQPADTKTPDWGLAYIIPAFGDGGVFGHSGAYHGWIACVWFVPTTGDALIVLTNGTNADRFLDRIESVWVQDLSARGVPWKTPPSWSVAEPD